MSLPAAPPAPLTFSLGSLPGRDDLLVGVVAPRDPVRALALLLDLRGTLVGTARGRALGFARSLLARAGRPALVVAAGTTPALLATLPGPADADAGDAAPALPGLPALAARVRPGACDLAGAVELLRLEVARADRGPAALDVVAVTDRPGDLALVALARDGARVHVVTPKAIDRAVVATLDQDDPTAAVDAALARLAPPRGRLALQLTRPPLAWFRRAGGPVLGGARADLPRVEVPAEGIVAFVASVASTATGAASTLGGAPLGEASLDGATIPLDPASAGLVDDDALLLAVLASLEPGVTA